MAYENQNSLAKKFHLQMGQQQYPLLSYQYDVILGGYLTSFSKITGIVLQSSEVVAVNEGGRNQPYLFRDSKKNFHTMVLEKGYGTVNLINFYDKVTDVTIILRNQQGNIVQAYSTSYAVVQEIKFSDLNASTTEVLIQSMSIAYTTLSESKDVTQTCRNLEKNNTYTDENITSEFAILQNKKSNYYSDNRISDKNTSNINNSLDFIKQQNKKSLEKENQKKLKWKQKEQNRNSIVNKIDFSE